MTLLRRAATLFATWLAIPVRIAADRRDRALLAGFDDRCLADVGLTRPDLGRPLALIGQDRDARAKRARQ